MKLENSFKKLKIDNSGSENWFTLKLDKPVSKYLFKLNNKEIRVMSKYIVHKVHAYRSSVLLLI